MQARIWHSLTHSLWLWALATWRFRHLGHHFMKPGDFDDISVARYCILFKLNKWAKELHKRSITFDMHESLSAHPSVFQSILNPIHWQKVGKSCCIPWTFWKYLLFNTTSPLRWKTLISSPMLYMYIMKDGSYRKTCIHASLYHQLLFTADGSIHKNSFTNQSS